MSKRQKFILSAVLLSFGLMVTQWVEVEYRYVAIFGFFLTTFLVSAWALFEDLKGVEWITILSLPSLYAAAVGLFYFLLPDSWLSRTIILGLFGLGLYALYLTENIYSVASIRTIQLLRAAHAVGFLLSVLTLILFYNSIFSFRWPYWQNGLAAFAVTVPIMLQGLWSVKLEKRIGKEVLLMTLALSFLVGQLAVVLSFLPATVWIAALFLATFVYVSLGISQHALNERLFARTLYEYLSVGLFVLIATLLVMPWR
jgi:hypothetical protein